MALLLPPPPAAAREDGPLVGHGGPVMDVAVSSEGLIATASFDNSVGLWRGGEPQWLEGHTAAVDSVAFAGDRIVSGGDDFAVRLWDPATGVSRVIGRHRGKVADLAVSGGLVASAGWDGAVGLWPLEGGREGRTLAGHQGAVNAVAFVGDALATGSADGSVRLWDPLSGRETGRPVEGGFPVGALAAGPGWLAYGAADGTARVIDPPTGRTLASLDTPGHPVLALAVSEDGGLLAMGGGDGRVIVVETAGWQVVRAFQGAARGPIWALAFRGDRLLGAGVDPRVPVWAPGALPEPLAAGAEASAPLSNGERQFVRKCAVCHTLTEDGERRAGPPLGGVIGRPAGAVEGYPYSEALLGSGLVWQAENVDALFDVGPDVYLPGTIMPTQRIADPDDRRDLIAFLAEHPARDEGGSE